MTFQLRRADGGFARVGHRGASALAPENTVEALQLAVELGCDMLEFDVLARRDRTLVLAHSLHDVTPDVPTLDDVLSFCSARLPGTVLQVDLKQRGIEAEVVEALRRHGVMDKAWVSGFDAVPLLRLAQLAPELPRSYTLPRDRFGISKRGPLAPVVRTALSALGASLPRRLPKLIARTRVQAVTLHHSVASPAAIDAAHDVGAAVYVWTVDDADVAARLVNAGADGIITNDPRIFREFQT